jgi:ribonucleoside-diphosphate reductase alpha chain
LDNVIELNKYPIAQIREATKYNRRMGLGVMGFAKMLTMIGVRYDSEEAYEIGAEMMRFITEEGRQMSHELGRARGSFPGFKESFWAEKYDAMRNATISSIAPTGTISMIADTSSGIEPLFALAYIKTVMDGTRLFYSEPIFERILKVRGIYSQDLMKKVMEEGSIKAIKELPEDIRNVFTVSHDIHPDNHVKMQAAFQKYTDLAVSKTINLSSTATVEDVEHAYLLAWRVGCKGITVYRDGSRGEGVLSKMKKIEQPVPESEEQSEEVGAAYKRKREETIAFIKPIQKKA